MDRDELAALDAAATKGPCEAHPNHWGGHTLMSFTDAEISDSYVNGRPYWKVADTVSKRDADLITYLRNHVPDILDLIDENARLRAANGILEDALQEVGDDYPGSSCQQWCQHQVKAARAVLSPNPEGEQP